MTIIHGALSSLNRTLTPIRQPIIASALTLAAGFLVVAAVSDQPFTAYGQLLLGNFSSPANIGTWLTRSVPILLIGLGIVFAFRGGIFNVGGEGQLFLGALASALTALALPTLPGPVLIVASLGAGVAAGAIWGWIPGILKVVLGVDEVVTTLMLNFIAILFTGYLMSTSLRDQTAYGATSQMIPEQSFLPGIPGLPNVDIGILLVIVLVPAAWVLLFRTEWGADLRAAGTNLRFAQTAGVRAQRNVVISMMLSGGMAGLAGAVYVLGTGHRFEQNFSPGLGLIGLTVALLAREHPIGVVFAALFYALILNGSALMQIETNVPRSLVDILTGLLVLIMTVQIVRRRRAVRSR